MGKGGGVATRSDDSTQSARLAETRALGSYSVAPIGFGAMRLAGPNVFGPPADRAEAVAILRDAVENGVNHIDTAEYYGPAVVNELIREALSPFPPGLVLVSKVGAARGRKGEIFADDQPKQLRRGIEGNLKTLGVDSLAVVNLRLMRASPPDGFFDDQLGAMIAARDDGLIGAVGLSNVSVAQLQYASARVEVPCVQNAFHPADRSPAPVLEECTRRNIAFVPFAPLGFGSTSLLADATLRSVATRLGCTSVQACLAWELALAPNILLIPGTSSRHHLHENLAASRVRLDADALREISTIETPAEP
jgi:pyridoxine 4-dehydrogenase